jgi:hypothetical protein
VEKIFLDEKFNAERYLDKSLGQISIFYLSVRVFWSLVFKISNAICEIRALWIMK